MNLFVKKTCLWTYGSKLIFANFHLVTDGKMVVRDEKGQLYTLDLLPEGSSGKCNITLIVN